jgi:hypothetical protein
MRTFFDIPNVEDIPAERRAALEFDLEANGFSKKPIFISLLSSSGSMVVDQPERVAVAAAMGMSKIPVHMTIVQPDILLQRCGPGRPAGFNNVSISGESTPQGGAALPAGSAVVPPPTEPGASDSSNPGETTPPGGPVLPPGTPTVPPPTEPPASES